MFGRKKNPELERFQNMSADEKEDYLTSNEIDLYDFTGLKTIKREGNKFLLIARDSGDTILAQYLYKDLVDEQDVMALWAVKDYFAGDIGCDGINIMTSGKLSEAAKIKISELGAAIYDEGTFPDPEFRVKFEQEKIRNASEYQVNPTDPTVRYCPKCGVLEGTHEELDYLRFCPNCGARFISAEDAERNATLDRLDNANTEELVEGFMRITELQGYTIIHRDGNHAFFMSADGGVILGEFINSIIDKQHVTELIALRESYAEKGLVCEGIILAGPGAATEEAKILMEEYIDGRIQENLTVTSELADILMAMDD